MFSNDVQIKDGRIVPNNIFFKDVKTKDRSKTEILEDIQDVKEDIAECKKEGRFYGDIQEELKDLEKELSEVGDSKTKDETYSEQRKALEAKLKQAQQDGDTQKAKEIQEEINELIKNGVKDATVGQNYHVEEYSPSDFYVEDPAGKTKAGPFRTKEEAQAECNRQNQSKDCQSKDVGFGGKGYKCRNCGATDSVAGKIKHVKDEK